MNAPDKKKKKFQSGHLKGFGTTLCSYLFRLFCGEQRESVTAKRRIVIPFFVMMVVLLSLSQAQADTNGSIHLYVSLYTKHYDPEPNHVNDQQMLGIEFYKTGNRLLGVAIFDNSFGQESQYLYVGKKWSFLESDRWYFKLTGGLLHGYKEPYADKIPLNGLGIAPAIVPTIGYNYKNVFAEFAQLGLAAGMINVGITF
jgi:hypothetical protein